MNKHLIYYLYCDSYELYEVYRLHFNCINTYNDIFYKYTFILSFDDVNDNNIITYWKSIVKDNINTNKEIEFIIVQNTNDKEGIHFYNNVFKQFNNFNNELILFGHGKRDFLYDKEIIYNWIGFAHYQLSFIDKIEDYLINDKYCHIGALLFEYFDHGLLNTHYSGSFYWIYPDKILMNHKKRYNEICNAYDNYIYNKQIFKFAENWFNLIFNTNEYKSIGQKKPITESISEQDNYSYAYIYDNNDIYFFNIYNSNLKILDEHEIFENNFLNEYYNYKEQILINL